MFRTNDAVVATTLTLLSPITTRLTYAFGRQIDPALGTGRVGDIGVNPLREYQLFHADLNWKF